MSGRPAMSWRGAAALAMTLGLSACTSPAPEPPPAPPPLPDLHVAWQGVLDRYVENGAVDYKALRAARGELTSYLQTLEGFHDYARLSRADQLAFWINAHNAYAVDLILEYWPVGSILEATPMVKRGVGGAFALDFIPLGHVMGSPGLISLDDIAAEVLRGQLAEPRAVFALARACRSCPELRRDAYRGDVLDSQLEDAARHFLGTPGKNRLDSERRELILSPLFQWHAADLESIGGPIDIFRRYGPSDSVQALDSFDNAPVIRYARYDWSLNRK